LGQIQLTTPGEAEHKGKEKKRKKEKRVFYLLPQQKRHLRVQRTKQTATKKNVLERYEQ
jgi:hypothetical protein